MDLDRILPDRPLDPVLKVDGTFRESHGRHHTEDAVHIALRDARIALWRDLWWKVDHVEEVVAARTAELIAENARLVKQLEGVRRNRNKRKRVRA